MIILIIVFSLSVFHILHWIYKPIFQESFLTFQFWDAANRHLPLCEGCHVLYPTERMTNWYYVNASKWLFVINVWINVLVNSDEKRSRASTNAISRVYSSSCCWRCFHRKLSNGLKKETRNAAVAGNINSGGCTACYLHQRLWKTQLNCPTIKTADILSSARITSFLLIKKTISIQ